MERKRQKTMVSEPLFFMEEEAPQQHKPKKGASFRSIQPLSDQQMNSQNLQDGSAIEADKTTNHDQSQRTFLSIESLFESLFPDGCMADDTSRYCDFFSIQTGWDDSLESQTTSSKTDFDEASCHFIKRTISSHPADSFGLRLISLHAVLADQGVLEDPILSRQMEISRNHYEILILADAKARACSSLLDILKASSIVIDGKIFSSSKTDIQEKLKEAMDFQLQILYPNRAWMIQPTKDAREIQEQMTQHLYASDLLQEENPNQKAMDAILQWILSKEKSHQMVQAAALIQHFQQPPYGWKSIDTAGCIGVLFGKGDIVLENRKEEVLIPDRKLASSLCRMDQASSIQIHRKARLTPAAKEEVRTFLKEYFSLADVPVFRDELSSAAIECLRSKWEQISSLLVLYQNNPYPGKQTLLDMRKLTVYLMGLEANPESFLFHLHQSRQEMLQMQENAREIEAFFEHDRSSFDQALLMLDTLQAEIQHFQAGHALAHTIHQLKGLMASDAVMHQMEQVRLYTSRIKTEYQSSLQQNKKEVVTFVTKNLDKAKELTSQIPGTSSAAEETISFLTALLARAKTLNTLRELLALKEQADRYSRRQIAALERIVLSTNRSKTKAVPTSQAPKSGQKSSIPASQKPSVPASQKEAVSSLKSADQKTSTTSVRSTDIQPKSTNSQSASTAKSEVPAQVPSQPSVKKIYRFSLCKSTTLSSQEEAEAYAEEIRQKLLQALQEHDVLQIE